MKNENGLPSELKELSTIAIKKQIHVNESLENVHHLDAQFLRVFNGSVMDAEMIKQRAEVVINAMHDAIKLLETITKPYLD
jgi:hypothetical protein